jgi:hypothetical protein
LQTEADIMERKYWIGRTRAAIAMARAATEAEIRLIHCERAGRSGIRAAEGFPFMLAAAGPSTEGELAALQIPFSSLRRARRRRDPGRADAERRRPPGNHG